MSNEFRRKLEEANSLQLKRALEEPSTALVEEVAREQKWVFRLVSIGMVGSGLLFFHTLLVGLGLVYLSATLLLFGVFATLFVVTGVMSDVVFILGVRAETWDKVNALLKDSKHALNFLDDLRETNTTLTSELTARYESETGACGFVATKGSEGVSKAHEVSESATGETSETSEVLATSGQVSERISLSEWVSENAPHSEN